MQRNCVNLQRNCANLQRNCSELVIGSFTYRESLPPEA